MIQLTDIQQIEPVPVQVLAPDAVAKIMLAAFDRHYALFRYGAQRAKSLFESGDWQSIQQLSRERIEYYDMRVRECIAKLEPALAKDQTMQSKSLVDVEFDDSPMPQKQRDFWQSTKLAFVSLLADHRQPECAETFFNSVSCRVLHRDYFHNDFLFVRPAVATDYLDSEMPAYRVYYPSWQGLRKTIIRMVADFGLAAGFENLPRDARLLAGMACQQLNKIVTQTSGHRIAADCQVQVLGSLFFRNKAAFIVGRLINQGALYPFAIPLVRTTPGQVRLDALLCQDSELTTLFSFTRAYFLVDMEVPAAYVQFISTLMPRKPKAEIYTMLGLQKQGKTLFYRDFLQHLAHSTDNFDIAPGIKGMVMGVFTLPSYPYVFKLIKDKILKDGMTHKIVRAKYQMVKMHDRVGRLSDTWEYSQVALPKNRFSAALLKELREVAPNAVEELSDTLVFKHLYIERRMTPLNIYLQGAPTDLRNKAIIQYGDAIKQLAAANIFPGDMLYKNFGVTRLGRVVFYDYDEIQRMTEMNFRAIPPAPNEEAEMASEPWYAVGPNDVFPEEFATFLLGDLVIRKVFQLHHADLLTPQWWQKCRERVAQGRIEDRLPYGPECRLSPHIPEPV